MAYRIGLDYITAMGMSSDCDVSLLQSLGGPNPQLTPRPIGQNFSFNTVTFSCAIKFMSRWFETLNPNILPACYWASHNCYGVWRGQPKYASTIMIIPFIPWLWDILRRIPLTK